MVKQNTNTTQNQIDPSKELHTYQGRNRLILTKKIIRLVEVEDLANAAFSKISIPSDFHGAFLRRDRLIDASF